MHEMRNLIVSSSETRLLFFGVAADSPEATEDILSLGEVVGRVGC